MTSTHSPGAPLCLADSLATDIIQSCQAVALAAIAAYVAIRTRQIELAARAAERRADCEQKRTDELEVRVEKLEGKRKRRKPTHPDG